MDTLISNIKCGLDEHGLMPSGQRACVTGGTAGFREWLAIGSDSDSRREFIDRHVNAHGGYEATCRALFGDRRLAIDAPYAAGDPKPIGSVTPAWVAMQAIFDTIAGT
jgi:hypothetical protein